MRRLFDERARIVTQRASSAMDRSEYFERVCRGGYPEVNELVRQASRQLDPPVTLHHYRTRDRAEVNVIAEAAGRLELIEAKWTELPARSDAVNLAFVREAVGPTNVASAAIVCRAPNGYPLDDGIEVRTVEQVSRG